MTGSYEPRAAVSGAAACGPTIVISEFMDAAAVDRLQRCHDTHYEPGLSDRQDTLCSLMGDCRALIVRNRTQVRQSLLDCAPKLSCVGRLGVGLDNIDLESCRAHGITVYPAAGANDRSVAEYVIAAAMILLRGAYAVNRRMIGGGWPRSECAGSEVFGKTLGLIGFGSIAQTTAQLAAALGMLPVAFDPFLPTGSGAWRMARQAAMPQLLAEADVLSIHVPLTEATRHLIGAEELRQLKPGAVLINTSRGGVVDEAALTDARRRGLLSGFALDVFESEPLNAAAGQTFAGLDNLILTPHIAGVTAESNQRVSSLIADKVIAHLQPMG